MLVCTPLNVARHVAIIIIELVRARPADFSIKTYLSSPPESRGRPPTTTALLMVNAVLRGAS